MERRSFRISESQSVHYSGILPAGTGDITYVQASSSDISANVNIHPKWDKKGFNSLVSSNQAWLPEKLTASCGKTLGTTVFEVWEWWAWDGGICSWVSAAVLGKAQASGALGVEAGVVES